jgi:hypothetical protein
LACNRKIASSKGIADADWDPDPGPQKRTYTQTC